MELIDPYTKWWNSKLIHDTFFEDEAYTICQIPLSPVQANDSLIWRGTSHREFPVRNVYHMEKELHTIHHGGSSRQGAGEVVWMMIWNLKIPNVVEMFMWKACYNLLPTKMDLFRRGVVIDSLCLICLREDETVNQILWSCPSVQDVWRCGPKKLQKGTDGGSTFFHIFEELLGRCHALDLDLVAVLARKIWFHRNGLVHGAEFIHPQQVLREA
jgi:hypothetical protein